MTKKIKTQEELAKIVKKAKSSGEKIGFTNGCFDVLHLGHVRYLNDAKKECDILVIALNRDKSVKSIKGPQRPINCQEARMEVLASLENVDFVTLFDEDTPEKLIRKLTPDILFKGGDWNEEEIAGSGYVKAKGGMVKIIPYIKGYSTTELITKLRKNG